MAPAVPDHPSDPLTTEIERSRRYRHALTLVRVATDPSPPAHRGRIRPQRVGRPGHRRRDPLDDLAAELRRRLRSGDIAWSDGSALFVLLPETDAAGAAAMLTRLRRTAEALIGEPDIRVASFPEHGLTYHALRAAVARRTRPVAEPESRPGGASSAWLAAETTDR